MFFLKKIDQESRESIELLFWPLSNPVISVWPLLWKYLRLSCKGLYLVKCISFDVFKLCKFSFWWLHKIYVEFQILASIYTGKKTHKAPVNFINSNRKAWASAKAECIFFIEKTPGIPYDQLKCCREIHAEQWCLSLSWYKVLVLLLKHI